MQWSRIIALVDMNAFFASIEQRDYPELRGLPVVVTNGEQGTCIITCSYEARAYGIKTGMRLKQAKQLCPHVKICPSRPERYAAVSAKIMQALQAITPDLEVFSVDEAFLDVTHCQALWRGPEHIGRGIKQLVYDASGLLCSVGISGDKTTAKFAAKLKKPNGLTLIHPAHAKARLASVPVTELCGIAKGIGRFLNARGVFVCGDMARLPIGVLGQRFGPLGRRIWLMCQGQDPLPVKPSHSAAKSLGHGKVMPPNTSDRKVIQAYLRHMCEKLSARLRRHHLEAQCFFVGLRRQQKTWLTHKFRLVSPTQHGDTIYQASLSYLLHIWRGEGVCQIQVTALDPQPFQLQADLFNDDTQQDIGANLHELDQALDAINQRFGAFTIMPASLLGRSAMHDVIAPAWRPAGSRRSV